MLVLWFLLFFIKSNIFCIYCIDNALERFFTESSNPVQNTSSSAQNPSSHQLKTKIVKKNGRFTICGPSSCNPSSSTPQATLHRKKQQKPLVPPISSKVEKIKQDNGAKKSRNSKPLLDAAKILKQKAIFAKLDDLFQAIQKCDHNNSQKLTLINNLKAKYIMTVIDHELVSEKKITSGFRLYNKERKFLEFKHPETLNHKSDEQKQYDEKYEAIKTFLESSVKERQTQDYYEGIDFILLHNDLKKNIDNEDLQLNDFLLLCKIDDYRLKIHDAIAKEAKEQYEISKKQI